MKTTERRITGVDGISLFLRVWSPDQSSSQPEAKAVIQFLHGQGDWAGIEATAQRACVLAGRAAPAPAGDAPLSAVGEEDPGAAAEWMRPPTE